MPRCTLPTLLLLISSLLMLLGLTACTQTDQTKLVLAGSSTVAPLVAEIAKRFEAQNPGFRIDVQTGGSSRGVNDAIKGLADIGMASRALKPSEPGLQAHTIAWDGITVIVNQANPVERLSHQQIIDIYTGQITHWSALGGPDKMIVVVNKAQGRSTLALFLEHFQLSNPAIKAHIIIGDNQQGLKTVAGNPWAIAYVSVGAAVYETRHGAPLKLLALEGIEANLANIEKGIFPLARPLNLITKGQGSATTQRFIQFAQSTAVTDLITAQYFIPAHTMTAHASQ